MKSNLLFTPILKTKAASEYKALYELESNNKNDNNIIPYIEAIKEYNDRNVKKYIDLLKNSPFFFEPINDDVKNVIANIDVFPKSSILVLKINTTTTEEDIQYFIESNRKNNKRFGLKVDNANNKFDFIFNKLNDNDFLFIELNGTSYASSDYLTDIKDYNCACKIIIHSDERNQYLRGEDFVDNDFNEKSQFNTSIIDSIKTGTFDFDGFGSRCSAKNENTEQIKRANEVYGVFLVYSFDENNFYSIKSDTKEHISRVYTSFLPKLRENKEKIETKFLNKTIISKNLFSKYIDNNKLISSKLITVSIVRYVEEIMKNL